MTFLLDTTVISELTRPEPCGEVVRWLQAQDEAELHLSAVTLGEVAFGLHRLPTGAKRLRLQRHLDRLEQRFADRVLAFDLRAAEAWALLRRKAEQRKRSVSVVSGMLAATAEVHGLTIVTRDAGDFEGWSGPVLSPWPPQPSSS